MLAAEQAAGVLRACFVDDASVSAQAARLAPRLPAPAPAAPPRRAERAAGAIRCVRLVRRDGRDVSSLYGRERGGATSFSISNSCVFAAACAPERAPRSAPRAGLDRRRWASDGSSRGEWQRLQKRTVMAPKVGGCLGVGEEAILRAEHL